MARLPRFACRGGGDRPIMVVRVEEAEREGWTGMRTAVSFQDQRLELEVADDRLIGQWPGPSTQPQGDARALAMANFEAPIDFPPLGRAVVPGDRVVVPLDPSTPELAAVL